MKIAIVTLWYNEEDLAPFFLKHYSYVDCIILYLDVDTNDSTRSICEAHSNVTIRDMSFPDGYDSIVQVGRINRTVRELGGYDWVYALDSDEFIVPPKQYRSAQGFLTRQEQQGYNTVRAQMFQVFRHVTDDDLDISKPVLSQRRHGDPDLSTKFNRCYIKPIVIKPESDITWLRGCHICKGPNVKIAEERFYGAHWKMADRRIAIRRRIYGMRMRFSARQVAQGMSWQDHDVTEASILRELERHKRDPDVLSPFLRERS